MRQTTLISIVALGLVGCSERDGHGYDVTDSQEPHEHAAATYKDGHGVQLAPAARAFIALETAEFKGRLPSSALLRTAKGDFVYVVNGDWFLRTPVVVTEEMSAHFAVKEGLYDGDVVVTSAAKQLWLAELQAINGGVGCADHH